VTDSVGPAVRRVADPSEVEAVTAAVAEHLGHRLDADGDALVDPAVVVRSWLAPLIDPAPELGDGVSYLESRGVLVGELVGALQEQILTRIRADAVNGGPLAPLWQELAAAGRERRAVARAHDFGQVLASISRQTAQILDQLGEHPLIGDTTGGMAAGPLGRPIGEVDPLDLEVHPAIESGVAGLPVLPVYIEREHDRVLGEVVAAAAAGRSRVAVLVGGSSTGKTRACWEALQLLRDQPPDTLRDQQWRLWHPIAPTRADAALADLARIGRYTVVWLNEAQFYLADPQLGERVAAGLRELLRDPGRAPVLVLATWPAYWNTLTTRSDHGVPDLHAQARELLDGHRIGVLDAFTGDDLDVLNEQAAADPRLGQAAEHARDGQIIQYLAGGPVLENRYHDAPPATKALIHAAMDARRLGCGPHLPLELLSGAAPGYLTDTHWDQTGDDWIQQALDYVTAPCNGIPGILSPVKTGTSRNQRASLASTPARRAGEGAMYRLADYLDQHGRRHRREQIPPVGFWTATAAYARPADLAILGSSRFQE
jgi:hypothetical protein